MTNNHYVVIAPAVVSEIIDGEAVILNLKSNNYYSSTKCGAKLWEWIVQGNSLSNLVELAQQNYSGDTDTMKDAVTSFVNELLRQELVKPADPQNPIAELPSNEYESPDARRLFEAPELEVYGGQELLLLDPIHDVDEEGWPPDKEGEGHVNDVGWPSVKRQELVKPAEAQNPIAELRLFEAPELEVYLNRQRGRGRPSGT